MKQNDYIRDCLNESLSGLSVTGRRHNELMNEITGGMKVKKKLTTSLVLAMVLLLLAAAALAWGLSYAPGVSAELTARNAVMQTYGLSREAMDMFGARCETDARGTTVRFTALGEMKSVMDKTGVYTVFVAKDGSATATWSHDDQDPASWADGSLEAEVWGPKQILAFRAGRDQEFRAYQAEWESLYGENGTAVQPTAAPTASPQGRLSGEQALEIAANAVKRGFGFTDETLALFSPYVGLGDTRAKAAEGVNAAMNFECIDEARAFLDACAKAGEETGDVWMVAYYPSSAIRTLLPDGASNGAHTFGCYVVTISDETGAALQTAWSLQDKDTGGYTEHTWGRAEVYHTEILPWVLKLADVCEPILQKEEAINACLSVEDKAAFDQAFRDAGFSDATYNHALPQADDLSREQALELAAQALEQECGVSRAVFDASAFAYADLTQEKDHREWYFWLQNNDELCGWSVVMNAKTGEILFIAADPYASSNG